MKPQNIDQVDPLGEIRRRAKELWELAGNPSNKTWEDYWDEAEQDLLCCGRTVKRNKLPKKTHSEPKSQIYSEQLDPLMYFITSNFGSSLSEIEASCLGLILSTKKIELINGQTFGPLDISSISKILAELAYEYDNDFFKSQNTSNLGEILFDTKTTYWQNKLSQEQNHPLTNAQRNTLSRFTETLAKSDLVAKVVDAS